MHERGSEVPIRREMRLSGFDKLYPDMTQATLFTPQSSKFN